MNVFTISGHSDDLFRVADANGLLLYEASAYNRAARIVFDDGTLVRGEYNWQGYWDIEAVFTGPRANAVHTPAADDNYTDTVTITGDVSVIACWTVGDTGDAEHVKPINRNQSTTQPIEVAHGS